MRYTWGMLDFTPEERALLRRCATPAKVQGFLDSLRYNWERDGKSTLKSFRRVVREKNAHCLEGAVTAAAMLAQHGHRPLLLCMEARDIDHNLCVFRQRGKWGAVAQSRDATLRGRPARFRTLRDLVLSYYPYYWHYFTKDHTDLTIRGFALVDLSRYPAKRWVTSEADPTFIEDHLWGLTYTALWPTPGRTAFVSPRKGKLRWVKNPRSLLTR